MNHLGRPKALLLSFGGTSDLAIQRLLDVINVCRLIVVQGHLDVASKRQTSCALSLRSRDSARLNPVQTVSCVVTSHQCIAVV